jgi:hypothetical protein
MADDTLDDVIQDITDEETVEASVITLLDSLGTQLANAGNDPAKITQVRSMIAKDKAALAAAVLANTPAATPPAASSGS